MAWKSSRKKKPLTRCNDRDAMWPLTFLTFLTFLGIPMICDVLAVISGPLLVDPDSGCQETLEGNR